MRSNLANRNQTIRALIILVSAILLIGATLEIFHFAQGSGTYLGEFSLKRGLVFIVSVITSTVIFLGILFAIWKWEQTVQIAHLLVNLRDRTPWLRWILVALILVFAIVVFQYTIIGSVLTGIYFRLIVFLIMGLTIAFLITSEKNKIITSSNLALSFLFISSTLTFVSAFKNVVDYPFSLGWSEGNRIWNYSVLFDPGRYNFPADQPIFAYVDKGRQSLWGLPFLFPNASIIFVRLWDAFLITLPYAILGWITFRRTSENRKIWVLSGLWAFVFLSQGPIYTPLVLSAILVALAWRSPLWIALPLIVVASYYAQLTRFTWMFAPALWIGMLYLGDRISDKKNIFKDYWGPAIAAVVVGLFGGDIIPRLQDRFGLTSNLEAVESTAEFGAELTAIKPISVEFVIDVLSRQPLIWNRLFPNPTFGPGILLALSLVTIPLIIYLIYLVYSKKWSLVLVQKIVIVFTMTLFLLVGLVISTKIGGGGDLHNMDMSLIGLVFVAALAWKAGADRVLGNLDQEPGWIQFLLILMMAIFAIGAVKGATPSRLPSKGIVEKSLNRIQDEVTQANQLGQVLLLDQRQLLTFGYIENVPLVTDYEKVYLMDQAMSGNANYFEVFNEDITNQRFSLIISEPLKVIYQGSDHHFGDENDAWVKWVSEPVLCYYEPIATLNGVRTQLLVPREVPVKCP